MIPESEIKVIYTGNSKATEFPFSFKFNDKSDIKVALRDIATDITTVLAKDYFVDTIKSVVLYPGYQPGQEPPVNEQPEVLPSSKKIIIYRETPLNQTVDLGDKYPMGVVEGMDDKNLMICQELKEKLDRCVAVDIGADINPKNLIDSIFETAVKTGELEVSVKNTLIEVIGYAKTTEIKKNAAIAAATAAAISEEKVARSAASILTAQGFIGDFHDIVIAGYYYTAATGQTNAPNSTENFMLTIAAGSSADYVVQKATGFTSGKQYINVKTGGAWMGWSLLATSADAKTRINGKIYEVGDIVYSTAIPSWARLQCVTTGAAALTEPAALATISTAGTYVVDGTVKWIVDDMRDMTPVGRPVMDLILKDGYLKINGSVINRADYPRLLKFATDNNLFYDGLTVSGTTTSGSTTISNISTADIAKLVVGMMISGGGIPVGATISSISTASIVISVAATASGTITITYGNATNFPGLFGKGDGSTTFVLPNLTDLFLQSGNGVAGQKKYAGLPNISGSFQGIQGSGAGAFNTGGQLNNGVSGYSPNYYTVNVNFNANASNSIYGNSPTVQPPAANMIIQTKY